MISHSAAYRALSTLQVAYSSFGCVCIQQKTVEPLRCGYIFHATMHLVIARTTNVIHSTFTIGCMLTPLPVKLL